MLTRLKVTGFKNLVDVDVRFGPFTCIAGPNGSGKSNLFDAITFLSLLASDTLINAAMHIRDEKGRTGSIRNIFHRVGDEYAEKLDFEAEMLIPQTGVDDLGQEAKATKTFVAYRLTLKYSSENAAPSPTLEVIREELTHIKTSEAQKHISFPHEATTWRNSVVKGRRTTPFISTERRQGGTVIKLAQDGRHGRPREHLAAKMPRTVLSTVNATESPTALLARREMQSWRLLQLEPSALREPDGFSTPPGLGTNGAHLPITLFTLADSRTRSTNVTNSSGPPLCDVVAFSLGQLIDDVRSVRIDRDVKRELYTLEVEDKYGTFYPARSLSDGTLRFLALAVLKVDPKVTGLICLEEPENGIHPQRIPAMIDLLQGLCVDPSQPISDENPLRQVIVNTHSPAVVSQVPEDSLLVAHLKEIRKNGKKFKGASFLWLSNTWRATTEPETRAISSGKLAVYLNPIQPSPQGSPQRRQAAKRRRVADRPEFQLMLPFPGAG
ncbi:MAG: AAA family ATPase [Chloroflexi bacterium]|nr:AAA family ATPase [Chloroflexota bacterium]